MKRIREHFRAGAWAVLVFSIIGLMLMSYSTTSAQSEGVLNKLLAPGPLMKGHAHLEGSDCLKCHDAGKGVPDSKCLDCHNEIRHFVEKKRGFHGLVTQSCRECHADHKGRDFNSLKFDEKNFDHFAKTGFRIDGSHSELKCTDCHTEKRDKKVIRQNETRWFAKTSSCVSCHKKDDIHFYSGDFAKKDCNACHTTQKWAPSINFDHARDAKFKLEGKHAELKCTDCHVVDKNKKIARYKWKDLKTNQCLSCHENVHSKKLSKRFDNGKCVTCHSQETWKISNFNHQVTGYKLGGRHAEINCQECHKQTPALLAEKSRVKWKWVGLSRQCLSCHADEHKFGKHIATKGIGVEKFAPLNSCTGCHTDTSWKSIQGFKHNFATRFVIDGKHEPLKCAECHLNKMPLEKTPTKIDPGVYRWTKLAQDSCVVCHNSPHVGQFSAALLRKKCTECHVTEDWFKMKGEAQFDHSKTRFPLTGAHKTTSCSDCHKVNGKSVYKFPSASTGFCTDCHKTVHTGMLSPKNLASSCTTCHTTMNFTTRLDFDHSKTQMPLKGAHRELRCDSCHTPSGNRLVLFTPNVAKKTFPDGKQFDHSRYLWPSLKRDECLSCHADVHKGQLSRDCLSCHSDQEWKIGKFDHNRLTEFPLKGKHQDVNCKECHKPFKGQFVTEMKRKIAVINYSKLPNQCAGCHEDVHKGNFGNKCQECHSERGWEITKDFHRNFTLTGVHYALECAECHTDGRKLAGLSQQCTACHQKDDVHFGALPNCKDCHRQHFWEVTAFRHSLSNFPLRGAHRTLDCVQCHKTGAYQGLSTDCISCHAQDAINATTRVHDLSTDANCVQCHRQQFAW